MEQNEYKEYLSKDTVRGIALLFITKIFELLTVLFSIFYAATYNIVFMVIAALILSTAVVACWWAIISAVKKMLKEAKEETVDNSGQKAYSTTGEQNV